MVKFLTNLKLLNRNIAKILIKVGQKIPCECRIKIIIPRWARPPSRASYPNMNNPLMLHKRYEEAKKINVTLAAKIKFLSKNYWNKCFFEAKDYQLSLARRSNVLRYSSHMRSARRGKSWFFCIFGQNQLLLFWRWKREGWNSVNLGWCQMWMIPAM